MDTEALAVAAVKTAIAKTNYLTDYIKDKDKEPMWDGAIYAYSSKDKKNSDWIGKASVQIKGKNVNELELKELKYDIEVCDLKNYKMDGGLLFFVVAIDEDGDSTIFYKALTPFLINKLIELKQEQKTIRVIFSPFPKKANEICNVVMDFIRDSKKQELFTHDKIPTLEEFLDSAGENIQFGFQYSGIGYDINAPYKYLFGHEVYMYATNTKLNINFPMEHIHSIEKASHSVEACVKIGGKEYYNRYDVVHKKDGMEIHIGKSIIIDFDTLNQKVKVNYKLRGNIEEQINDIQFMTDFLKEKQAKLNDIDFPIEPTAEELESFHVDEAVEFQKRLIKINDMLKSLGVKKPLELDNISQKDDNYLKMLMKSIVNGEEVTFKEKNVPPVGIISIGNIHLVFCFKETENGKYIIKNFTDLDFEIAGEYKDGTMFKTSKYVIFKADDIIKVDNCTCKQIVDELKMIDNDGHYFNSNLLLLEILKAYDKTNENQYLDEALRLAKWLRKAECLKGISTINYYQCMKRKGLLSEEQEEELINLIEEYDSDNEIKAASYILIENYKMAKRCLNKLKPEERETFKTFPIYKLYSE